MLPKRTKFVIIPDEELSLAVDFNQLENVKLLLKDGADPNSAKNLYERLVDGCDIVKLIIQAGYDVNQKDDQGCTLLMRISLLSPYHYHQGCEEICKIILAKGARIFDVFRPAVSSHTFACMNKNIPFIRLLDRVATERQLCALLLMHKKRKFPIDLIRMLKGFLFY